jgi:hypothetical protein
MRSFSSLRALGRNALFEELEKPGRHATIYATMAERNIINDVEVRLSADQ